MRITDLLDKRSVMLGAAPASKSETLDMAVSLMAKSGKINDEAAYRAQVYKREEEGTTGIGEGIAIPHGKCEAVTKPGLAAMVIPNGVDFDSLDGEPVDLLFLIAAPNTKDNVHLDVLSKLSMMLMDEDFTASLKAAKSVDEFLEIINKAESEKDAEDGAEAAPIDEKIPYIIAVTACPTGIAHTYMAAEAIEKKCKASGYQVKVETRGSGGAKNVLTEEDIEKADGIIVACDTKVPMDRFDGKRVVIAKVAEGINKTDELIEKALSGTAPVFTGSNETKSESEEKGSIGHQIYKHLMSGVSHMLPFVIGGGIMIAIAFLIDTICGYGATGGGNFGNMTAISSFFKYAGGLAMGLMVPVLAGYIAYSIADRPGLAVGFTGGLLAASGNAVSSTLVDGEAVGNFVWFGKTSGLGKLVGDFAFQGAHSGNTVSGFLGGIVAGFVAGYLVLLLKKATAKLPKSLDGIKPTLIYPLGGVFLISVLMCFIFNPLIGLVNTGLYWALNQIYITGSIALLGLVLGAMMAIDMGGPINKAAYVFGTTMLGTAATLTAAGTALSDPAVQACYISMASIMVGGMVPPVGIAIACLVFPKKFTKAERGSVASNFVMGSSFITEGAIPFAAADPAHVIPCTLVGSGVAGCLSAIFKCTLMAPHGGIFVFATVGKWPLYILAWVIGSAITAVMLGLIKKPVEEA